MNNWSDQMIEYCEDCVHSEYDCETDYYGDRGMALVGCREEWVPHYDDKEETITCKKHKARRAKV